jgi:lipoprotein-anchoring transpeptidase ErfK/SrfK
MGSQRLVFLLVGFSLATLLLLVRDASPATVRSVDAPAIVGAGTLTRPTVVVRARPDTASPRIAVLTQFRPDFHPRVVLALAVRRAPVTGAPAWYRVSVPGRPNGRTGWIRAAQVELAAVDRRVVVYRESRRFELWLGDRIVRSGPVAVGAPGMETPLGLYYVTARFRPTWPVLGAFAFETSAYSKLSEWPGGGVVGLHGTNAPQLLGRAVSHGCIRLHDRDALFLRTYVRVGTPIQIVRA